MADSKKKAAEKVEDGKADLQAQADVVAEQGYVGYVPDLTPNENYTVKGVTSGAPTPETDRELREQNRLEAAKRRGEV